MGAVDVSRAYGTACGTIDADAAHVAAAAADLMINGLAPRAQKATPEKRRRGDGEEPWVFDLVDITAKRAALTPDRVAFEDALSGRTLTYAQLEDRVQRGWQACSQRADVGAEDRVAILCRNRIEFFEIMFACAKLGGHSRAAELAHRRRRNSGRFWMIARRA